ncbi:MAG TPA: alpha/beta hydrolase [Candidatus Stackebrandtia excrementipullorum]|nr:alpha/beta hydrolase [Candidatus Stackebrandtia excrementipullorum]
MTRRHLVLVPGADFGPYHPLLFLAVMAARDRGMDINAMAWDDDPPAEGEDEERSDWVNERVESVLIDDVDTEPMLVGRSLGSYAAVVAATRELPAIWFTPLLDQPSVVNALESATAPVLLVGGTGDPAWDGDLARRVTKYVVEIPHANHGFRVPGQPLTAFANDMGTAATAVENFMDASW